MIPTITEEAINRLQCLARERHSDLETFPKEPKREVRLDDLANLIRYLNELRQTVRRAWEEKDGLYRDNVALKALVRDLWATFVDKPLSPPGADLASLRARVASWGCCAYREEDDDDRTRAQRKPDAP